MLHLCSPLSSLLTRIAARYGIPTTSESSDTCVSDSESLSEPKQRYPQRLRMIVTGDVCASSSADDAPIQVFGKQQSLPEHVWTAPSTDRSTTPQERAQQPPSSSSSSSFPPLVSKPPPPPLDDRAFVSTANASSIISEQVAAQLPSEWTVLDHCIYPVGPAKPTDYRVQIPPSTSLTLLLLVFTVLKCLNAQPFDKWLASSDQECFLSCWVSCPSSPLAPDGHNVSTEVAQFADGVDDPIAQMLKARESALLAALR